MKFNINKDNSALNALGSINKRFFQIFFVAFIVLVLDLFTKFLTHKTVINYKVFSFLSFSTVKNYGAGFGILEGKLVLLVIVSIIFLGLLIYFANTLANKLRYNIVIGLIVGGAVGNLFDRLAFGYVRDYINFHFFPVFNIADAAITVGAVLLIIGEVFFDWKFFNKKNNKVKKNKK